MALNVFCSRYAIGLGENRDPLLAKMSERRKREKPLVEEIAQFMRPAVIVEIDKGRKNERRQECFQ